MNNKPKSRPHCFALTVGANREGRGSRFTAGADRRIQEITAEYFGEGFSILHAEGGWYDAANKKFIREESRQILVSSRGPAPVKALAQALAKALKQKEIFVVDQGPAFTVKHPPRR